MSEILLLGPVWAFFLEFFMPSKCDYIVVHCSASPNAENDGRFDTAADINRWHEENGWQGIGYHYVIDEEGGILAGRPVFERDRSFMAGAHTRGHNRHSVSVCLIGDSYFHEYQLDQLAFILRKLKRIFPAAKIVGHRDLDSRKTCPNFDVKKFLENRNV